MKNTRRKYARSQIRDIGDQNHLRVNNPGKRRTHQKCNIMGFKYFAAVADVVKENSRINED